MRGGGGGGGGGHLVGELYHEGNCTIHRSGISKNSKSNIYPYLHTKS